MSTIKSVLFIALVKKERIEPFVIEKQI